MLHTKVLKNSRKGSVGADESFIGPLDHESAHESVLENSYGNFVHMHSQ